MKGESGANKCVSTDENNCIPVYHIYSVNTYECQPSHKGVSEMSERARECSERASIVKRRADE